jgi:hypothetical protein
VSHETGVAVGVALALWFVREIIPVLRRSMAAREQGRPSQPQAISADSLPPKAKDLVDLRKELNETNKRLLALETQLDPIVRYVEKQMGIG